MYTVRACLLAVLPSAIFFLQPAAARALEALMSACCSRLLCIPPGERTAAEVQDLADFMARMQVGMCLNLPWCATPAHTCIGSHVVVRKHSPSGRWSSYCAWNWTLLAQACLKHGQQCLWQNVSCMLNVGIKGVRAGVSWVLCLHALGTITYLPHLILCRLSSGCLQQ